MVQLNTTPSRYVITSVKILWLSYRTRRLRLPGPRISPSAPVQLVVQQWWHWSIGSTSADCGCYLSAETVAFREHPSNIKIYTHPELVNWGFAHLVKYNSQCIREFHLSPDFDWIQFVFEISYSARTKCDLIVPKLPTWWHIIQESCFESLWLSHGVTRSLWAIIVVAASVSINVPLSCFTRRKLWWLPHIILFFYGSQKSLKIMNWAKNWATTYSWY